MDKNIAFILSWGSENDNENVKDPLNDLHKKVFMKMHLIHEILYLVKRIE